MTPKPRKRRGTWVTTAHYRGMNVVLRNDDGLLAPMTFDIAIDFVPTKEDARPADFSGATISAAIGVLDGSVLLTRTKDDESLLDHLDDAANLLLLDHDGVPGLAVDIHKRADLMAHGLTGGNVRCLSVRVESHSQAFTYATPDSSPG